MSRSFKRMQGLGWVALVFLVAISLYPLSLRVGAMHLQLVTVDGQIIQARKDISYLQAEIRTRASMEQLEQWNDLLYGYQAPSAGQYLTSERALADLQGNDLGPSQPVMVSAAYGLNAVPAGTIGNGSRMGSPDAQGRDRSGASLASAIQVRPERAVAAATDGPAAAKTAASTMVAASSASTSVTTSTSASTSAPAGARTGTAQQERRVAQLETSLLGPSTLRDLQRRAADEKARK